MAQKLDGRAQDLAELAANLSHEFKSPLTSIRCAPIVMFSHPDAIKTIFTGDEEDLRAGEANVRLEPILGRQSLLLLDGKEHLRERRLLQPPFHGNRMLAYGPVMCSRRTGPDAPARYSASSPSASTSIVCSMPRSPRAVVPT